MEKHSYLMMVDENNSIINILNRLLEMDSLSGEDSRRAQDALNLLMKNMPNLVLLDIRLPSGDGRQVLEEIRGNSLQPVVKISASVEIATLGDSLESIIASQESNATLDAGRAVSSLLRDLSGGNSSI